MLSSLMSSLLLTIPKMSAASSGAVFLCGGLVTRFARRASHARGLPTLHKSVPPTRRVATTQAVPLFESNGASDDSHFEKHTPPYVDCTRACPTQHTRAHIGQYYPLPRSVVLGTATTPLFPEGFAGTCTLSLFNTRPLGHFALTHTTHLGQVRWRTSFPTPTPNTSWSAAPPLTCLNCSVAGWRLPTASRYHPQIPPLIMLMSVTSTVVLGGFSGDFWWALEVRARVLHCNTWFTTAVLTAGSQVESGMIYFPSALSDCIMSQRSVCPY